MLMLEDHKVESNYHVYPEEGESLQIELRLSFIMFVATAALLPASLRIIQSRPSLNCRRQYQ